MRRMRRGQLGLLAAISVEGNTAHHCLAPEFPAQGVDRLFARADLTLADLARAAGSTPHLVSEALNRYAGVSFHERLMRVRVEDVKTQLVGPASDRYTIEGIGLSAGFGSRSALYAAFRKLEGRTPAAFRNQASGGRP